jgi:putative transposase
LGSVENGEMKLNKYGEIVEKQWNWLEENFSYVELLTHVVMPNHMHGIVIIHNSDVYSKLNLENVGNGLDRSLQNKILPLWNIIGAFKTTSSKFIHEAGFLNFKWQKSFYDRVIRNETELLIKQQYILNNPPKWELDRNNPNRKSGKYYFEF